MRVTGCVCRCKLGIVSSMKVRQGQCQGNDDADANDDGNVNDDANGDSNGNADNDGNGRVMPYRDEKEIIHMISTHHKITDVIKMNFTDETTKMSLSVPISAPKEGLTLEEVDEVGRFIAMGGFFVDAAGHVATRYICAHKEHTTVEEMK